MKDLKSLRRLAADQGWTFDTSGKHDRWISPTGQTIIVAATPGEYRALMNARATLRRAGLRLPRKDGRR